MKIQPEPLKKLQEKSYGSVFIDNLTVACALHAIKRSEPWLGSGDNWWSSDKSKTLQGRKWNYAKNDAFRFAVDLYSLAQLVEAIVLFDKIFVDYSFIRKWKYVDVNRKKREVDLLDVVSSLHSLVVPVELTSNERTILLLQSNDCLRKFAEDGNLQLYMELLSLSSIESSFLHLTNGYFGTGYADNFYSQNLLRDLETQVMAWELRHLLNKEKKGNIHISRIKKGFRKALYDIDPIIKLPSQNLLDKTLYPSLDRYEKEAATLGVAQNALAAYFYENMASSCGVSYLPHIIRSNFVLHSQVASLRGNNSTSESILHCLEEFRHLEIRSINSFYEGTMIDMDIPFILAMILKNVSKPTDILTAALELRNSEPAKRFRLWAVETDRRIASGEISLNTLSKEIEHIKNSLAKWTRVKGNSKPETVPWSVAISLGPASISLTIPIHFPKISLPRRRHFIFIQRLAQVSNQTPRFATLIRKVFGREAEIYWQEYCRAVDLFTYPPTDPNDPRLRFFSKQSEQ